MMRKLSRRQEMIYGMSAFGPNMLLIIITSYIMSAFSSASFGEGAEYWTFSNAVIIAVGLFTVLGTISRVVDAVVDVPLAGFTDKFKSRFGRRRPTIAMSLPIMILAFFMVCIPLYTTTSGIAFSFLGRADMLSEAQTIANSVWAGLWSMVLYTFYTLCLTSYYGTFAEITRDAQSRMRLSNWKALFDTVSYCIAYALVPVFIGSGINIQYIALFASPLMLTMIIPFFIIKESSTLPKDVEKAKADGSYYVDLSDEEKQSEVKNVSFWRSFWNALSNKKYLIWMFLFGVFYMGLQMFLAAINEMGSGAQGFTGGQIAITSSAAFAPIPLMLFLNNKIMRKKGFAFAFRLSILSFAIAMSLNAVAYVGWMPNVNMRLIIAVIAGVIGSYGIGSFFASPYFVNAQFAADARKKGSNNTTSFFVVQGLFNGIGAAITQWLIWYWVKHIGYTQVGTNWVRDPNVFEMGSHIMLYIVVGFTLAALVISFFLPKEFHKIGLLTSDSRDYKERQTQNALNAQNTQFTYTGTTGNQVLIRLAQVAMTVCSLGIALPWAYTIGKTRKCRDMRFDGKEVRYEGTGFDLFKKYILWWLLCIVTGGIFALFLPVKIKRYSAAKTCVVDESGKKTYFSFEGKYLPSIGYMLLGFVLIPPTLFLRLIFDISHFTRYCTKHTKLGGQNLYFDGSADAFFSKWAINVGLCMVTGGIYALWTAAALRKWTLENTYVNTCDIAFKDMYDELYPETPPVALSPESGDTQPTV